MTDNRIDANDLANDRTALALVATIKAAVNGAGKYAEYVDEHFVNRENVKHHAAALAALAYPNEPAVQKKDGKRTKYGNAVQAAGNGLRAALDKGDPATAETDYLAKVIKAAQAAHDHEVDADSILSAIAETLGVSIDLSRTGGK